MTTYRGFIAVEIPTNQKINAILNEIRNIKTNIKLVEPENIHVTLKFLGDVEDHLTENIVTTMTNAVQNIQPFTLTLKHTGVFPNTNYIKVLWIGVEDNGTLETIAKNLDQQLELLGFKKETRPFSSHLTIGRVKTAQHKEQLMHVINKYAEENFGEYHINQIILKKSDLTPNGPIYTTIKEIKI